MNRLLALATVALVAPQMALADRLDNRLLEEAPKLVASLKDKKVSNVGVLRFQVNMPGKKPSYSAPLSGNLVTRLETGLIIHVDEEGKPAMGVIRDAGMTAARNGIGMWSMNSAERKRLFAAKYPLAWGNSAVKPDAFLTGKVDVSKDLKKTTLTVLAFDRNDPEKLQQLVSFTVPTDRHILRDLGYSFSVPVAFRSRAVKKPAETDDSELDTAAIEMVQAQLKREEETPRGPDDPKVDLPRPDTLYQPDNIGGVSFRMLVEGKAASFRERTSEADAARWEIDAPEVGKKFAFELKNPTDKKLGVVLRINGYNIINMQTSAPEYCGKIILAPGKTAMVRGFIQVDETAPRAIRKPDDMEKPKITIRPFDLLINEEAAKFRTEHADKAGLLEVDVFEEGGSEPRLEISPRGLPPSKDKVARETYKGLRTALLASSGLKVKVEKVEEGGVVRSRAIIIPRPAEEQEELKANVKDFPNPLLVARIAVRVVPAGSAP